MARIVKKGTKTIRRNYSGNCRCKKCGCEFTYLDHEVCTKKTGARGGFYSNGVYMSSDVTYDYVECPQCKNRCQVASRGAKAALIAMCFIPIVFGAVVLITLSALGLI